MADRWQYAQDKHPPYCTCTKCLDEHQQKTQSKRRGKSGGGLLRKIRNIFRK